MGCNLQLIAYACRDQHVTTVHIVDYPLFMSLNILKIKNMTNLFCISLFSTVKKLNNKKISNIKSK